MSSTVATVALGHPDFPGAGARPARCQVVVVEGPDMGRAAAIARAPIVVGTDPACDLVLRDPRVSRKHLRIETGPEGQFVIADLGSKNGTLYQGAAVGKLTVPAGGVLRVGHTTLRIQPEPAALAIEPSRSRRFGELVGESLVMREVFAVLELAAASDVAILLEGETGTGKEVAARALHGASGRARAPFVALDCGALPESLVESELFGHVKGAFTGAMQARRGAFARAHGGTLFLDELDSLPLALQPRLLRALEARTVRPVGGDDEVAVDVRVVAASQRDLAAAVAAGAFRPDLYYRLSVLRVALPPLRARREDLAVTARALLAARGFEADDIDGPGLARLAAHDWPGNVRELRNTLDRALALSPAARRFADLRLDVPGDSSAQDELTVRADLPYAEAKQRLLHAFERSYLRDLLARSDGNISAAARTAEVDRKHLRTLLRKHGLVPDGGADD
ncbi:sigma 54-interacting transcriptional regulator [Nannocystis punicea]|uniref:Sigma 54-interacting transcriptional regulator n=1 Tax=Nannocystis punicea TaxID=2995304 RepID=A0ABY7HAA1_9BACT|nr:sigma 54-interacting transcriptional regulator [Nannocystis poenicansa]WAS95959.1 sigma 54-interacting transcriptional regulator [Nannocystis poenicansa]